MLGDKIDENQNIEFKEKWKDEYLQWICGFANANGGTLFIGFNDDGELVGVKNAKKLSSDIPNKINQSMNILNDINVLNKDNKDYIQIIIYPSHFPVDYKGVYYYRTGSTRQILTGRGLSDFLLKKSGLSWDGVSVDGLSIIQLDKENIESFKKESFRANRLTENDLTISDDELLNKLGLCSRNVLKRAAILLFYNHPEEIIVGAYTKIAYFNEHNTLMFHDVVEGSLIKQANQIIDLIYTKYLKADISYEHDKRVEKYPYPRDAVREAVHNALIHKNYSDGNPIQIKIEPNKMYISNSCVLPQDWTVSTLYGPHQSIPYNPLMANVFFKAGYIEAWGSGIKKLCDACRLKGIDNPIYSYLGNMLTVEFNDAVGLNNQKQKKPTEKTDRKNRQKKPTEKTDKKSGKTLAYEKKIITLLSKNKKATVVEIAEYLNLKPTRTKEILYGMNNIHYTGTTKGRYYYVEKR